MDIADIGHSDGGPVDCVNRQRVELGNRLGAVVEADIVLIIANLGGPRRHDLILCGQRHADIICLKVMRLKCSRIDIYLYLALAPTIGRRHRRTFHGCQRGTNEVLAQIENLLLGQAC